MKERAIEHGAKEGEEVGTGVSSRRAGALAGRKGIFGGIEHMS